MEPFVVLLATLLVLLCWYLKSRYSYWSSMGVPTGFFLPFLGHIYGILFIKSLRSGGQLGHKACVESGGFIGRYQFFKPQLCISEPDIIKLIFIKDFDHFTDRPVFISQEKDTIIGQMLSNKSGEEWKALRSIMSPTFSSGKMKVMFPLVCRNADTLVTFCLQQASTNPSLDMKDMSSRYAMDNIASCAFGIECNSFAKEKPVFTQQAETFFSTTFYGLLKLIAQMSFPRVARALGMSADGPEIDFFRSVVEETIRSREESGQKRGDFLDLILEARDSTHNTPSSGKIELTNRVVLAQSIVFLIAGNDTVSSSLFFVSHLLAQHPEQQQRLRQELQTLVKEEGELTYHSIMEAKLLDACINEGLRLYPPANVITRTCTKPYQIPGTNIRMQIGDEVLYNVNAVQMDPRFWQDPEQYHPDRFLPHNRANITPGSFLPFGLGPRNCIAMRFAQMELKVALSKLLLMAELKLAPGHEDIKTENWAILTKPVSGSRIVVTPLNDI